MRARVTTMSLAFICLLLGATITAQAQDVRNGVDLIWARDVDGAEMTLDGELNEPVWQQAETIDLVWNGDHPIPGSGQRTEGNPALAEPSDPNDGTIYLLRDGNTIWLGADVRDQSIGGATGLWGMDGLIMNILDRARFIEERTDEAGIPTTNFFQGNRTEFFISWWNGADTTDASTTYDNGELVGSGQPLPGVGPRLHGFYGGPNATEPRDEENVAVWDAATTIDGITNDDTHGDDTGYVIEMRLDAAALGYDFTQADGDKMAWNIALQDHDFAWPVDEDTNYLSRVWWQNQWGNNFNEGAAYIVGAPDVTVNSDAPEVTEPEFTIPSGAGFEDPTIDGSLAEEVWESVEPSFYVQYQPDQELINQNPEIAKYYVFYFRPDINGDDNQAIVVDPSIARFKMFFKDEMLYVGLDVDDQAVSGTSAEGGMDGIYLFLRDRDSLTTQGTLATKRFDFSVDSTGAVRYGSDALMVNQENPSALQAAVSLKGSSTAADPSDVDEGYQIEIAIDLQEVLNYPEGLGDGKLWTAMNFLDGDFLESQNDSYATRTWIITERGGSGASIYGYLDANVNVARESDVYELPGEIRLDGNYPNPFNPSTTLHYRLPQSGSVSVHVFDALGRSVTTVETGMQSAGRHELQLDAGHLASGAYFYRVQLTDEAGTSTVSEVGRMVLIK